MGNNIDGAAAVDDYGEVIRKDDNNDTMMVIALRTLCFT